MVLLYFLIGIVLDLLSGLYNRFMINHRKDLAPVTSFVLTLTGFLVFKDLLDRLRWRWAD